MIYLFVIISLLAFYLLFDNLRQKFAASEFKSEREAYREYAPSLVFHRLSDKRPDEGSYIAQISYNSFYGSFNFEFGEVYSQWVGIGDFEGIVIDYSDTEPQPANTRLAVCLNSCEMAAHDFWADISKLEDDFLLTQNEMMANKSVWDEAREYDSEYDTPASKEAYDLWACIEDKPHKALGYIQDALDAAKEKS